MLYGASSPGGKAKSAVDDLGDSFKSAPDEEYLLPIGIADVKRQGRDVTIVATGLMVHKAFSVAGKLSAEGIECEIVDPRTITPLDTETILESLEKTGRLVIVTESNAFCGFAAELAALAACEGVFYLDAPVRRVCAKNSPIPFAPVCEAECIPSENDIEEAVRKVCKGIIK